MDGGEPSRLTPERFRELAVAELDALYRLAHYLALDAAEADDLVQETYAKAFHAAPGFVLGPRGMRPWLMRILNNVLRTRRRDERRMKVGLSGVDEPVDEAGGGLTPNARLADLDWEQVGDRLKAAVLSLPVELRITFLLFAVEDLKYREIAEVLDVPIGTVMSRLNRARQALIKRLPAEAKKGPAPRVHPEDAGASAG